MEIFDKFANYYRIQKEQDSTVWNRRSSRVINIWNIETVFKAYIFSFKKISNI